MRMLMNNLDPDVAERPEDLVVYGGIGKAARNWDAYDRIVENLKALEDNQTLLVQSGKPVAVMRTMKTPARPHRQLKHRSQVGNVGLFPRAR